MERITEDRLRALVDFLAARVSEVEAGPAAAALRLVVDKQVSVIRYLQVIPAEDAAVPDELATAGWNLLVDIAGTWRERPDFPAGAAVQTFDLNSEPGQAYLIHYPPGLDDYDFWEIEHKGWLDITVSVGGTELPISIYDQSRLDGDIKGERERLGYFAIRNLVVVEKVGRPEIEAAVAKLAARGFVDLID